jgi:hypothetical protein
LSHGRAFMVRDGAAQVLRGDGANARLLTMWI